MGANIAGIYGAQIFRSDDRPRYRRAFVIGIGVLIAGTIAAVLRYLDDVIRRRNKRNYADSASSTSPEEEKAVPPTEVVPERLAAR